MIDVKNELYMLAMTQLRLARPGLLVEKFETTTNTMLI